MHATKYAVPCYTRAIHTLLYSITWGRKIFKLVFSCWHVPNRHDVFLFIIQGIFLRKRPNLKTLYNKSFFGVYFGRPSIFIPYIPKSVSFTFTHKSFRKFPLNKFSLQRKFYLISQFIFYWTRNLLFILKVIGKVILRITNWLLRASMINQLAVDIVRSLVVLRFLYKIDYPFEFCLY